MKKGSQMIGVHKAYLRGAMDKWESTPGNSKVRLATLLGYKSTSTFSQWFRRGRVPANQLTKLMNILKIDLHGLKEGN